jgi:hypothetical protein
VNQVIERNMYGNRQRCFAKKSDTLPRDKRSEARLNLSYHQNPISGLKVECRDQAHIAGGVPILDKQRSLTPSKIENGSCELDGILVRRVFIAEGMDLLKSCELDRFSRWGCKNTSKAKHEG